MARKNCPTAAPGAATDEPSRAQQIEAQRQAVLDTMAILALARESALADEHADMPTIYRVLGVSHDRLDGIAAELGCIAANAEVANA